MISSSSSKSHLQVGRNFCNEERYENKGETTRMMAAAGNEANATRIRTASRSKYRWLVFQLGGIDASCGRRGQRPALIQINNPSDTVSAASESKLFFPDCNERLSSIQTGSITYQRISIPVTIRISFPRNRML